MATKGFIPPRRGHPYFSLNSFNFKVLRIRMWCRIRNYYFGLSLFPFAHLLPPRSITSKRSHLATRFQILTSVLLSGSYFFSEDDAVSAEVSERNPRIPTAVLDVATATAQSSRAVSRPSAPLDGHCGPPLSHFPQTPASFKAPTAEPQRGNPAAQRVASGL